MSRDQIIEKHTQNVKSASFHWAIEDLHQKSYDRFLDMLIGETDDRWVIPSYFVMKMEKEHLRQDVAFDLSVFLSTALQYEELYEEYAKETRDVLGELFPDAENVKEVFNLYEAISGLDDEERTEDRIREIIDNHDGDYAECFTAAVRG